MTRAGDGEYIDVAMTDVLATWTGAANPTTRVAAPTARSVPGYGMFATADGGHMTLGVLTEDHFWSALCDGLDMVDVRDLDFAQRMARGDDLQRRVASSIAVERRDDLVDRLVALGVPVAPLLDRAEMLALPHLRDRAVSTSDPWARSAIGYPVQLTCHPAARRTAPPELDAHKGEGFRPRVTNS